MNSDKSYMDFYDLFGLPTNADEEEIKKRTKSMIKKFHPDIADDDISATKEQFITLNFAKETLTDADKRAEYDELGHAQYVEEYGEDKVKGFSFEETRSILGSTPDGNPEDADELIQNNLKNIHESKIKNKKQAKFKPEEDTKYELQRENKNSKSAVGGLIVLIGSILTSRFVKISIISLLFIILFYGTFVALGILATIFAVSVSILLVIVVRKLSI